MTSEIQIVEDKTNLLNECFDNLLRKIGPINIGSQQQFPYGWRKAAKGRTVWRIVEEIINQNLEYYHEELNLEIVEPSPSEVSVYDTLIKFKKNSHTDNTYINIKSAVHGGKTNKDDLSKAIGLYDFYNEDLNRDLFIVTCIIDFNDNMYIDLVRSCVMPIAWIPDIYVNPSNNGNLQSSKYKDLALAERRTKTQFLDELKNEMEVARQKRLAKRR